MQAKYKSLIFDTSKNQDIGLVYPKKSDSQGQVHKKKLVIKGCAADINFGHAFKKWKFNPFNEFLFQAKIMDFKSFHNHQKILKQITGKFLIFHS